MAYERAAELSPNDPEVLIEYGSFLVEQIGDDPEATRIDKRTVAIDPKNASFHGRLGYIFLNAGDLAAAAISPLTYCDPKAMYAARLKVYETRGSGVKTVACCSSSKDRTRHFA